MGSGLHSGADERASRGEETERFLKFLKELSKMPRTPL